MIETAAETLHWALRTYRERVALAVSFGGLGGMVLLDLALKTNSNIPVYYIDTGLLFPETYAFIRDIEARYGIAVTAVQPELSLETQAALYGDALWERDPDTCCTLRKVEPQRAFLAGFDAWITGLHQTSIETRHDVPRLLWDGGANVFKISPLASWTDADVSAYARTNGIAYNPLLDQGYTSIGCVPCTRRVGPGEDPRAGRWSGFAKLECGLHLPSRRSGDDPEPSRDNSGVVLSNAAEAQIAARTGRPGRAKPARARHTS